MADQMLSGNEEKLRCAFMTAFGLAAATDFEALRYREIEQWSSVGHMRLVAEIEKTFDLMLETEDILDMSSFTAAREIVARYDVDFAH